MKATLIAICLLIAAATLGEIRCIHKMCACNWDPIGKAEVMYTIGAFTGLGAVIGYIDIQDK
jgi:hypothetical protein